MSMYQITPFVPCTSLDTQIEFYTQVLGFAVGFKAHNYAFLRCDGVAIRLVQVDDGVDLHLPERQLSVYIDVDDVDDLYQSKQDTLHSLPEGRFKAPFNQPFGQREFHVIDEDCTLLCFGHSLNKKNK